VRSTSRNLLLASSSRTHGTGYLDHCSTAVEELFRGVEEIGFVPYALADHAGYAATVAARFEEFVPFAHFMSRAIRSPMSRGSAASSSVVETPSGY